MGMISEFKDFAVKGNMIDMAVGIIIGGAFGKIISSLVADIIMPPIGVLMGGVDFTNLSLTLQEASGDVAAVTLKYGSFIQNVVDFIIIAFAIFIVVKMINSAKKKEAEKPAEVPNQEVLLEEIRDLLKSKA
jgi:large conductance mechanosensitive channel